MTIVEFLLARIEEDEVDAQRAAQDEGRWAMREQYGAWSIYVGPDQNGNWGHITNDYEGLSDSVDLLAGPHIARHDPTRILAECEAKRRIVEPWAASNPDGRLGFWEDEGWDEGRGQAVQILAAIYADHPDYDESWRS